MRLASKLANSADQRKNFCVCKYSMWLSQNAEVDADFESLKTLQKSSPQKVIHSKTLHKVIKVKIQFSHLFFVPMKLFSHELFPFFSGYLHFSKL